MIFDVIGSGIVGSVFGGLFRLAPEVLKLLDRKSERAHELAMFGLQTDLEKLRGEFKVEERYVDHSIQQLDTIKSAFEEQAAESTAAGSFVAAISALVRPGITWAMFGMYSGIKAISIWLGIHEGANWVDVILTSWTSEDFGLLNMIISFWFVGRTIEKYRK